MLHRTNFFPQSMGLPRSLLNSNLFRGIWITHHSFNSFATDFEVKLIRIWKPWSGWIFWSLHWWKPNSKKVAAFNVVWLQRTEEGTYQKWISVSSVLVTPFCSIRDYLASANFWWPILEMNGGISQGWNCRRKVKLQKEVFNVYIPPINTCEPVFGRQ